MSKPDRERVAVICSATDFEVLSDVLAECLHQVMEGFETHDLIDSGDGLTIYVPIVWTEEKFQLLQFQRLD